MEGDPLVLCTDNDAKRGTANKLFQAKSLTLGSILGSLS